MDVQKQAVPPHRRQLRIAGGFVLAASVVGVLRLLGREETPAVDSRDLIVDTVRRGDMVREVRGAGSLTPVRVRQVTAEVSARVESLVKHNGEPVTSGEVLLEMSNPDVRLQSLQADQQARQAQLDLFTLSTNYANQRLSGESQIAGLESQLVAAQQEADAADTLFRKRLIAQSEQRVKSATAKEVTARLRIERERMTLLASAIDSQLAVQQAQVVQLRAIAANQEAKVRSLSVRSLEAGVVQDLQLQLGQWVPEGSLLAKIIQPGTLKAVLKVPESQAAEVSIGQAGYIAIRNQRLRASVTRKDASAQNGTVTVELEFQEKLPPTAVPDLAVEGYIETERLRDVLFVGRPAYITTSAPLGIFVMQRGSSLAERRSVQFGRTSISFVEVAKGLRVGERVILSDMTRWSNARTLRVH